MPLDMMLADKIAACVTDRFKGLIGPEDFSFVCRRYDRPPRETPDRFTQGRLEGYRAQEPFYPASVIKVFFMVALFQRVRDGFLTLSAEDCRALENMIKISSNDATAYLVNQITGTRGGPALEGDQMAAWWAKRAWVNAYFNGFGWPEFDPVQVFHATYEESPYGREQTCREIYGTNILTPLAAASLMHGIASEQVIDRRASRDMMALLSRDWERQLPHDGAEETDQVHGFLVEAVPVGFRVWSKAGHTSSTRHDLVYLEGPDGRAMTIAAFSKGRACSQSQQLLPVLGQLILEDWI